MATAAQPKKNLTRTIALMKKLPFELQDLIINMAGDIGPKYPLYLFACLAYHCCNKSNPTSECLNIKNLPPDTAEVLFFNRSSNPFAHLFLGHKLKVTTTNCILSFCCCSGTYPSTSLKKKDLAEKLSVTMEKETTVKEQWPPTLKAMTR
jgi:hypothetical protein